MVTRLDRQLTAADLDDLPHEWDTLYELIGGVLYMSTKPSFEHQEIITRLILAAGPVVMKRGGAIVSEPGVVWELEGEDNVAPDIAIVFGPKPPKKSKLRRCPDICVEVLSPGKENRKRDLVAKRELYWRRGAKEYWIVDPDAETVLVLTRGPRAWEERKLGKRDKIKTPLLPDWKGLKVADLFA